jgi:hypothetical protein
VAKPIAAVALTKILGTMISDGGEYLMLHAEVHAGEPIWLSIPVGQATALAHAGGMAVAASSPGRMRDQAAPIFDVTRFEIGIPRGDSQAMVLSLTFGSGAILRFRLPAPMPQGILETLKMQESGYTAPKPKLPPN